MQKKPEAKNHVTLSLKGNAELLSLGGRETFGRYECRATNSYGEARQTIQVGGLADPALFTPTAEGAEPHGHTLAWSVRSLVPVTEYRLEYRAEGTDWQSVTVLPDLQEAGGLAAIPADLYSGRLRLERLTAGTVYRVRVNALNRYGWGRPMPEEHVFVTAGPKAPGPRFEPSIDTSSSAVVILPPKIAVTIGLEALTLLLFALH
jgi:hypothetical protein